MALRSELRLAKVKLFGCSGGALAAIHVALENPEIVEGAVADSFEGLKADPEMTDRIRIGRNYAKQNEGFCSMQTAMHGEDWERIVDADTEAVAAHAKTIGSFFHKPLEELKVKLFLTGSMEDEMFPKDHYEELFGDICAKNCMAKSHIFEHGGHPAMVTNMEEFISFCEEFFAVTNREQCNKYAFFEGSIMKNKAFVVIDLQNDITKNYKEIIDSVNAAVEWAENQQMPIVYIKHHNISEGTRTFKPGTKGAELVPELKVVSVDIFVKTKSNALTSEEFAAFITRHAITEFFVCGADATACVKSTCFNMRKAGYTVTVLSDCVTSYDKKKIPEMLSYYEDKGCSLKASSEIIG